jgi:hypothetical protein
MLLIAPLWFTLLILIFTRPIYASKLLLGLLLGGLIGLGFWMLVIAAYSSALADEPFYYSTSVQGYRVCSGPGGYVSHESTWNGVTTGDDNQGHRWTTSRWQGVDTTTVEPRR